MADERRAARARVGKNVRNLRKGLGLTQEELAWRARDHAKHIGQIERGEVDPKVSSLAGIAKGLSVDLATLFGPPSATTPAPRVLTISARDLEYIEQTYRIMRRAIRVARR